MTRHDDAGTEQGIDGVHRSQALTLLRVEQRFEQRTASKVEIFRYSVPVERGDPLLQVGSAADDCGRVHPPNVLPMPVRRTPHLALKLARRRMAWTIYPRWRLSGSRV